MCYNHVLTESGFNAEILSFLVISSKFFENLSFSIRSWFALWAESPAAVYIKGVIKGLCVLVFFFACRMSDAKQGDVFLITSRRHTNNSQHHMYATSNN